MSEKTKQETKLENFIAKTNKENSQEIKNYILKYSQEYNLDYKLLAGIIFIESKFDPNAFSEGNVNQHVCIIRCNELLLPDFLNYFLFSDSGQSQIRLGITGGNREGLNFENLKGFVIPAISIGEQQKIIDYLNHYCKNSFKLEEKINLQIEKLKEYRQSLISEAVTGKIDVKNYN